MGGRSGTAAVRRAALIAAATVVIVVAGSPAAMAAGEGSDLIVSAMTDPPATVSPLSSFDVTDTTQNIGSGTSVDSMTAFVLYNPDDIFEQYIPGTRLIGPLTAGATSTIQTEVTIPEDVPPGEYGFAGCADAEQTNNEGNIEDIPEQNNCFISEVTVEVIPADAPDLTVTVIGNPPAKRYRGQAMSVSDKTKNVGDFKAPATGTQYLLSENDTIGDLDDVLIMPRRGVPKLAAGEANQGGTTVTIPNSTPLGTYTLVACADGPGQVDETDETNNCRGSETQVTVAAARADLIVKTISDPPAEKPRGSTFSVTDTTKNIGTASAPGSQTWYRLSKDKQPGSDKALTGARSVPGIPVGGQHQGSKQVTIPASTAPGLYYVLACADGGTVVPEINEKNNCRASKAPMQVRRG